MKDAASPMLRLTALLMGTLLNKIEPVVRAVDLPPNKLSNELFPAVA